MQTALAELLRRFPDLRLDEDRAPLRKCESLVFRGFHTLPVRLRATA